VLAIILPASVTIARDDGLTWYGREPRSLRNGRNTLAALMRSTRRSRTTGKFGRRFTTAGTVHYFCSIHFPNMKEPSRSRREVMAA